MTFEQFQATRREVDDLGAALNDAHWEDQPPAKGYVYCDSLWIEHVGETWAPDMRNQGKYYLLLERCEWIDFDLEPLERRLYEFAVQSGFVS